MKKTGHEWPLVSVVLPVYNGETVLRACIDSLLALDYPAALREIIVVDNASTDATPSLLRAYGDLIQILFEPTRGAGSARNTAIRAAQHPLLAFVDADCVVDSGWLKALMRPFQSDPSISGVGGKVRAMPDANAIERFGEEIHDHQKAIEVWRPPFVISMNSALRRTVFDDVGLFTPYFLRAEDTDLSFRLHQAAHRLCYAPDAVLYHRNESTLRGLFQEGYAHGKWQVLLYREHAATLLRDHPRISGNEYRRLGIHITEVYRAWRQGGGVETEPLCRLVFYAGKKLGHAAGSLRFGYLRL